MSEPKRPRRGIPAEEFDADAFSESVLEITAVRRALSVDKQGNPLPEEHRPSRAMRAADDSLTTAYQPAPASRRRAKPEPRRSRAGVPRAGAEVAKPEPDAPPVKKDAPVAKASKAAKKPKAKAAGAPAKAGRKSKLGVVLHVVEAVFAVVVAIGLCIGVSYLPTMSKPAPVAAELVSAISRICPQSGDGEFTSVAAQGEQRVLPLTDGVSIISPVDAHDSVAGGTLVTQGSQSHWASCLQQSADQYIHFPTTDSAVLTVINAETTDALVDVTLTGEDGEITGAGLRGVTVPASSTTTIKIADFAPQAIGVGARVRASIGRVLAYGEHKQASGQEMVESAQVGTSSLLTGIPADATKVELITSNPGTTRNTVSIEAISEAGRSRVGDYDTHSLNAQRTAILDITDVIPKTGAALAITGNEPFSASVLVTRDKSVTLIPGIADLGAQTPADLLGPVAAAGTLMVANTSADVNKVHVDWGEGQAPLDKDIAGGTMLLVPVPQGAQRVRVTGSAPVGATLLYDAGLATQRLTTVAPVQASVAVEADPKLGR